MTFSMTTTTTDGPCPPSGGTIPPQRHLTLANFSTKVTIFADKISDVGKIAYFDLSSCQGGFSGLLYPQNDENLHGEGNSCTKIWVF